MRSASDVARNTRVQVYASWLADDVDGLIFNAAPSATLADVRAKVALALSKIDLAIAKSKEPA